MTKPEQRHIVGGFAFELGKCKEPKIRTRMLGHLQNVDMSLAEDVATALGMSGQADTIKPIVKVCDSEPSPALSQYSKAPKSLAGKKIALLTTNGVDAKLYNALLKKAKAEKAVVEIITPMIGPIVSIISIDRDAAQLQILSIFDIEDIFPDIVCHRFN